MAVTQPCRQDDGERLAEQAEIPRNSVSGGPNDTRGQRFMAAVVRWSMEPA